MLQERLSEAAIAFHRVLLANNIPHGIFAGYAIGALGGPRESKDVDCIARLNKQQITTLLNNRAGFVAVPQSREDYVAFLWSDRPNRSNAVLLEVFVTNFPGAQHDLSANVPISNVLVQGSVSGQQTIPLLDPVYIFKGKLRAAALRAKFHDSADLRWLGAHFGTSLVVARPQFDLRYVGLALRRYPELQSLFARLGLDLPRAQAAAASYDLRRLPPPRPGDVQSGLLRVPTPAPPTPPTPPTGGGLRSSMPVHHSDRPSNRSPRKRYLGFRR